MQKCTLSVTPHGALVQARQARRYSACCCSSPWAETARKERSGAAPKAPPPPLSRIFTMLHLIYAIPSWLAQHPHGRQRHCFQGTCTRKPTTCCGRGTPSVPPTYRSAYLHVETWRCRPCYTCPNQHGPNLSPLRHGCIPALCESVMSGCEAGFAHTLARGCSWGPTPSSLSTRLQGH